MMEAEVVAEVVHCLMMEVGVVEAVDYLKSVVEGAVDHLTLVVDVRQWKEEHHS
jgi:hypothetical protein